jgi:hypothetical protein
VGRLASSDSPESRPRIAEKSIGNVRLTNIISDRLQNELVSKKPQ